MITPMLFLKLHMRTSCTKPIIRYLNQKAISPPQTCFYKCIRKNHLQPCGRPLQDESLASLTGSDITYYTKEYLPLSVITAFLGTNILLYEKGNEKLYQTTTITPETQVNTANFSEVKPSKKNSGKPSSSQLNKIYLNLSDNFPKFFFKPHDFTIYHKNVIFDNNIRKVQIRGLGPYIQHLALIRILSHLRFAHVRMEVLRATQHPEDGTVRIRWRIVGIPGIRAFFFWRFWVDGKKLSDKQTEWIDGYSTFYVKEDGLIHRHVCDQMIPDTEPVSKTSPNMAAI